MIKLKHSRTRLAALLLSSVFFLGGCGRIGQTADPAQWGFTAAVTYNALGGVVNQREVRQTNYMPNSLVFEPSGTTNMLIQPVKDGYVLAGWYTNVTEKTGEDGKTVYEFAAQDRWDFNVDRVQDEMTLYARWVPQAVGNYIDPATDEVIFSKNLTNASPLQELSLAVLQLTAKPGYTMTGYFADKEFTTPYDFSTYTFVPLLPTDKELYTQLAEEFPESFVPFVYVSPTPAPTVEGKDEDMADPDGDEGITEEDDLLYIRKLGWDMIADDAKRAEIRTRKNDIIEGYIQNYITNSLATDVYLRFDIGNTITVRSAEDLKSGTTYGFFEKGPDTRYILANDIDMQGEKLTMSETFTGLLDGAGFTISNAIVVVSTAKKDFATEKEGALFGTLENAEIRDVTFENFTVTISTPAGVSIRAAALAVNAMNSKIENVLFDGLTIETGRGDDGKTDYTLSDSILNNNGSTIVNLQGKDVTIIASDNAKIISELDMLD